MFKTLKSEIWSLRNDVFERRTSTGSGFFVPLRHDFEQMFGQIFSIRVKALSNTSLLASRHIIIEKGPLSVDAHLCIPCLRLETLKTIPSWVVLHTWLDQIKDCPASTPPAGKLILQWNLNITKSSV